MKEFKRLKIARPSAKIACLLLLAVAFLCHPGSAFCQSKTSSVARLYIQVNVVPILHSEPPTKVQSAMANIAFDLNHPQIHLDRQASTRAVNDPTISQGQPIVLTTVTLTAK